VLSPGASLTWLAFSAEGLLAAMDRWACVCGCTVTVLSGGEGRVRLVQSSRELPVKRAHLLLSRPAPVSLIYRPVDLLTD
jgi:hypothetical protein